MAITFLRTTRALTRQRELDLARRIAGGSKQATFELANAVGPLVLAQAATVSRTHPTVEWDDLVASGWLGAAKAATAFVPDASSEGSEAPQFPAYAASYVRAEMMHEVRLFVSQVSIPEHVFKGRGGKGEAKAAMQPWREALSLDVLGWEREPASRDLGMARAEVALDVHRAINQLPAPQRHIVLQGLADVAGKDTAAELRVSSARVSQLRRAAHETLRDSLQDLRAAA